MTRAEIVTALKQSIDVRSPRNIAYENYFWAILALPSSHGDDFDSPQSLLSER